MGYQPHEHYMARAFELASKSFSEGGCPIGGVLVDNRTGEVLGEGHNALVQEGNPIIHGEMAALRAAGRMVNRHNTTMYTTLQPCFMCAGAITQFGIPRVVIGDVTNASNDETIRFLLGRGIEVIVLDPHSSEAARQCIGLTSRFRREKPEQWLEDWGGGSNNQLKPSGRSQAEGVTRSELH
jgi:cytosine deaminase